MEELVDQVTEVSRNASKAKVEVKSRQTSMKPSEQSGRHTHLGKAFQELESDESSEPDSSASESSESDGEGPSDPSDESSSDSDESNSSDSDNGDKARDKKKNRNSKRGKESSEKGNYKQVRPSPPEKYDGVYKESDGMASLI
ncbi:hypothetical protein H0H93_002611, partial [Arthromyces matolae]